MSAFSLDGKLSLDARRFVQGARQARESVGDVGDAFGKLPTEAKQSASKAADNVETELGTLPESTGKVGTLAGTKLGGAMIAGFGALGVSAILMESLTAALDTNRMVAKVNSAFRRTPEQAAEQGKIAGELYAGNWGESLGDLEHSVALTNQRIRDLTLDELEQVTKGATAVADIWNVEYDAVVRSVGQLLENDLAPTAEAALDIITAGFQDGADEAGDWLETIDEYSQHFAAMGLSGADATSIIVHGLQNGQRDADKLADAIKELRIRAVEDTEAVAGVYERIGLSAERTRQAFQEGGAAARNAYQDVLRGLMAIEDPVERELAAREIIGTQYEDLGPKALESLSMISDGTEDLIGRNQELIESIDMQVSEWDTLWRSIESGMAGLGEGLAGFLNDVIGGIGGFYSEIGAMGDAFGGLFGRDDAGAKQYAEDLDEAIELAVDYAATLGTTVGSFEEAREAAVQHAAALGMGEESWTFANKAATVWTDTIGKQQKAARKHANETRTVAEWLGRVGDGFEDVTTAAEDATDAVEDNGDANEEAAEQIQMVVDMLEESIRSHRRSADASIDAREAQRDFAEAVREADEQLSDQSMTMDEQQRLGDNLAQQAGRLADAQVAVAESTAKANGKALNQVERMDTWNDSMIEAAGTAQGPLRDSILGYIADVNGIPAEKLTEVQAAIDRGDLRTAQRLLDEVSETRQAAIIARTHNGSKVDAGLNWLARTRDARINVIAYYNGTALRSTGDSLIFGSVSTGIRAMAGGTDYAPGGVTLVGEEGPELVNLPRGAQVFTAAETQRMMSTTPRPSSMTVPAAASSNTINVQIDGFANETSLQHLQEALSEVNRRQSGRI